MGVEAAPAPVKAAWAAVEDRVQPRPHWAVERRGGLLLLGCGIVEFP